MGLGVHAFLRSPSKMLRATYLMCMIQCGQRSRTTSRITILRNVRKSNTDSLRLRLFALDVSCGRPLHSPTGVYSHVT